MHLFIYIYRENWGVHIEFTPFLFALITKEFEREKCKDKKKMQ